jgi:hypothetical protein
MKFVADGTFTNPDTAARKLVEIANATEVVQDGRIYTEIVNAAFLAGPAARRRNTAPASSEPSPRAGCGGMNPAPM